MILDLHRQGLSVSAIARQVGVDRKTVRTYIAKGLEPPTYKKRASAPGVIDRFEPYLRERLAVYPALTARRLFREIKERGFSGGYSVVRDRVRDPRPARSAGYEARFETPPGSRRKSTSPGSRSSSSTSRESNALSGCSRWCLATPA
jgi:transposase